MPGTIVVAGTATGVQPTSSLTIGGQNVLADSTQRYGAPLESIEVIENGPGGVSSLECTIDDPVKTIGIAEGMEVLFWNLTADVLRFRGYVDHWEYAPDFGGQGRTIKVSCTGVEAWLDWIRITADGGVFVPEGLSENIGRLVMSNAPQLRAPVNFASPVSAPWTRTGSFSYPLGTLYNDGGTPATRFLVFQGLVPSYLGLTLREAIAAFAASAYTEDGLGGQYQYAAPILVTVDFYFGVRVWEDVNTLQPDDYTTLTITDTTAGAIRAENLQHKVEPGDPIRSVYVKGGNAAGTGTFSDGTGIVGRMGYIEDALILDAITAQRRANSLIVTNAGLVRGSFTLSDFTPAATVHTGSLVTITDASVELSAATYRIYQIRKTFHGTVETWEVSYGGLPPSASRLIRKLTRTLAA